MAKPEWGTKRTCRSCGARFYDLKRDPIACPICEAEHAGDRPAKPRRAPAPAAKAPAPPAPAGIIEGADDAPVATQAMKEVAAAADSDIEGTDAANEADIIVDGDGDGDDLMEHDIKLDDDDDAMADVDESVDEKEII